MRIRLAIVPLFTISMSFTTALAAPTENRNLMDFCESYMKRLVSVIKENDIDYDLDTFGGSILDDSAGVYIVSVTAGTLDVKKNDLSVSEGDFILYIPSRDENRNAEYAMSFVAAFSALEHDSMEDSARSLENKILGDTQDCFEESRIIFNEIISPTLTQEAYDKAKGGEEVLVYSGNYDYFLKYMFIDWVEDAYDMYTITAKEHE